MKKRNVSKLEFWRAMFYTGEGCEQKNESEGGNKDVKKAGTPSGRGRVLAR